MFLRLNIRFRFKYLPSERYLDINRLCSVFQVDKNKKSGLRHFSIDATNKHLSDPFWLWPANLAIYGRPSQG